MTERLWISDPKRTTALCKVTAVRGGSFALDRTLFAPASRSHRHPQPADQGTVWWEGEKRWLERVAERDGQVWHTVRGAVPPVGTGLNCHLDQGRRELMSRAHTAMHLLIKALQDAGAPPLVADPEVKGGGNVRLELGRPVAPALLAGVLKQANAWVAADLAVSRGFVPRGLEARTLDAQSFHPPDPYPGPPDTLTAVRIGNVCAYPCDGTHVDRTGRIGRIVVTEARPRAGGATVVARVLKD
jgi:Ser-tRNA(Ala) deacylase AlaX